MTSNVLRQNHQLSVLMQYKLDQFIYYALFNTFDTDFTNGLKKNIYLMMYSNVSVNTTFMLDKLYMNNISLFYVIIEFESWVRSHNYKYLE